MLEVSPFACIGYLIYRHIEILNLLMKSEIQAHSRSAATESILWSFCSWNVIKKVNNVNPNVSMKKHGKTADAKLRFQSISFFCKNQALVSVQFPSQH